MTRPAPRMPHICCPHCGERAFARTAGKTEPTYREVYYHCRQDLACGHVFLVGMQILRTIRPAARPRPDVYLPVVRYGTEVANDQTSPAANDDHPAPLPPAANAGLSAPG